MCVLTTEWLSLLQTSLEHSGLLCNCIRKSLPKPPFRRGSHARTINEPHLSKHLVKSPTQ